MKKKPFVFNVYNHKVSNELNQVIIFSLFSNNFLKVNIYFEDLNYEVISEEPLYDVSYVLFCLICIAVLVTGIIIWKMNYIFFELYL